jgi:hypothetical protein
MAGAPSHSPSLLHEYRRRPGPRKPASRERGVPRISSEKECANRSR